MWERRSTGTAFWIMITGITGSWRRCVRSGTGSERSQTWPGSEYKAAFALVKDYDNVADARLDVWHGRLAKSSEQEIFVGAQESHTPYDIVYIHDGSAAEELQKYPVLIYPHPMLLSEKRAELLKAYVEQGGILIIGARSGLKDMDGHCVMAPMPGLLKNVSGSRCEGVYFCGARPMMRFPWSGTEKR